MMRSLFMPVVLMTMLGACATQAVYAPATSKGGPGYTETRLGTGRYRVTFTGTSDTPKEAAQDYALLRAAELSLQDGYDWFRLANQDVEKKVRESTTMDGGAIAPATQVYRDCGLLACQTTVVSDPTYGMDMSTTTTTATYTAEVEIVAGRQPKPDGTDVYDARDVVQSIRARMPQPH